MTGHTAKNPRLFMSDTSDPNRLPGPWWVWLNVLGVDAVLAALLWLPLFAWGTGARLVKAEFVVLGCAVWVRASRQ